MANSPCLPECTAPGKRQRRAECGSSVRPLAAPAATVHVSWENHLIELFMSFQPLSSECTFPGRIILHVIPTMHFSWENHSSCHSNHAFFLGESFFMSFQPLSNPTCVSASGTAGADPAGAASAALPTAATAWSRVGGGEGSRCLLGEAGVCCSTCTLHLHFGQ